MEEIIFCEGCGKKLEERDFYKYAPKPFCNDCADDIYREITAKYEEIAKMNQENV